LERLGRTAVEPARVLKVGPEKPTLGKKWEDTLCRYGNANHLETPTGAM
jgi:hypothetical protein